MLQSVTECYRVCQRFTDFYRTLQSISEYYRVLESVAEYYKLFLTHLLGPIFGLVIVGIILIVGPYQAHNA